jgi:hypothetical protein
MGNAKIYRKMRTIAVLVPLSALPDINVLVAIVFCNAPQEL